MAEEGRREGGSRFFHLFRSEFSEIARLTGHSCFFWVWK